MIRSIKVLFCDNDHGMGEQTFPPLDSIAPQTFINPMTPRQLRSEAKKVGWVHRKGGADYCEICAQDC